MRRTRRIGLLGLFLALAQVCLLTGCIPVPDQPPTAASLFYPVSGSTVTYPTLQLAASGAKDPEGRAVRYQFTVGIFDPNLVQRPVWISPLTSTQNILGAEIAMVTVPSEPIRAGAQYFLRVEAFDPAGNQGPSSFNMVTVMSDQNNGPSPADYYASVNLAPYGNRSWVNSGLTQAGSAFLSSRIAPLASPNPPTASCQSAGSLQSQINTLTFADMAEDRYAPKGLSSSKVTALNPLAQSVQAVLTEVKAKEPALYNLLIVEGGYYYRETKPGGRDPVPGSTSNHSWGTAVDIRLRDRGVEGGSNSVVTAGLFRLYWYFHKAGWVWGFGFGDPDQDNMHFEASQELLDYHLGFDSIRHV